MICVTVEFWNQLVGDSDSDIRDYSTSQCIEHYIAAQFPTLSETQIYCRKRISESRPFNDTTWEIFLPHKYETLFRLKYSEYIA